jgi:hypothetical protein
MSTHSFGGERYSQFSKDRSTKEDAPIGNLGVQLVVPLADFDDMHQGLARLAPDFFHFVFGCFTSERCS